METREELRKKLREKIRGKRNPTSTSVQQTANQLKNDPQTALMSMGIDDPEILKHANLITKSPQSFIQNMIQTVSSQDEVRQKVEHEDKRIVEEGEEEEEEAPPGMI